MQRERQRLQREQAALTEKMAEDAARARRAARKNVGPVDFSQVRKQAARALQRSVVKRVGAVLSSEGVSVALQAELIDDQFSVCAWTDFSQIYVGYHMLDDVKATAAIMRGAFYHEGGHCRFTVPFMDLAQMAADEAGVSTSDLFDRSGISRQDLQYAWNALEDQRMETAVASDSPVKAGYFMPMVMGEMAYDVDTAASNWPLFVWRRYLPTKLVKHARRLFVAKYPEGEQIARDFEAVTDTYVQSTSALVMWGAIEVEATLWAKVDPPSYDLSDAGHEHQYHKPGVYDPDALHIPIDPSMLGEGGEGGEPEDFVAPKDLNEVYGLWGDEGVAHVFDILIAAWHAPETLIKVQYYIPQAQGSGEGKGNAGKRAGGKGSGEAENDEDGDGEGKGSKGDVGQMGKDQTDEERLEEGRGAGQTAKKDEQGKSKAKDTPTLDAEAEEGSAGGDAREPGGSSGTHMSDDEGIDANPEDEAMGDDITDADLRKMLEDAEAQRNKDKALEGDVAEFHGSIQDAQSELELYEGGVDPDVDRIANASVLAENLRRAFEECTTELAPGWHDEQRRGILNVLRYETRAPGYVEFFRDYVDNGEPQVDIAVSLLLDYSGSMGGSVQALAQVAYGCKHACDMLKVPCTVVLWDTEARLLWDANETAEHLPVIAARGGTNPIKALNDIHNQRYGKEKHLVLIMTDDAWESSAPLLHAYADDGRTIIGLGYSNGAYSDQIAASLESKGADFAYAIADLHMIAKHLEEALVAIA